MSQHLIPCGCVGPDVQRRRVRLTPEETSDFYAEHYGKPDFSAMIHYMSLVCCDCHRCDDEARTACL